jgi:hypothetical protein
MTSPRRDDFSRNNPRSNNSFRDDCTQQPWENLSPDAHLLMRDILSIDDQIRSLESQLEGLLGARRLFLSSLVLNVRQCAGSAATAERDSDNAETSPWQDLRLA